MANVEAYKITENKKTSGQGEIQPGPVHVPLYRSHIELFKVAQWKSSGYSVVVLGWTQMQDPGNADEEELNG